MNLQGLVAQALAKVPKSDESIGAFDLAIAKECWDAAREHAAATVEAAGCNCNVRIHPNKNRPGEHYRDCPRDLARRLREDG